MSHPRKARRPARPAAPAPTLHDVLGTEPATSPGAAAARRVATSVGPSAYDAIARHLDQGDPLGALRSAAAARAAVDVLERQAVTAARLNGATWEQVGAALGVTRQGAQQRHGA